MATTLNGLASFPRKRESSASGKDTGSPLSRGRPSKPRRLSARRCIAVLARGVHERPAFGAASYRAPGDRRRGSPAECHSRASGNPAPPGKTLGPRVRGDDDRRHSGCGCAGVLLSRYGGMSDLCSARRQTGCLVIGDEVRRLSVIPAQAGIQRLRERHWVPASAGTTIISARERLLPSRHRTPLSRRRGSERWCRRGLGRRHRVCALVDDDRAARNLVFIDGPGAHRRSSPGFPRDA
jgi:hypothetical protein